jgi:hypothetical protein
MHGVQSLEKSVQAFMQNLKMHVQNIRKTIVKRTVVKVVTDIYSKIRNV